MLTPGQNEEMHFLTGPKIGPIRIVSRWARPVSLDRQSPVFVRATARSVADVLIPIIEQGAELHIIAHSHPGSGPGATTPSSTDIECLAKLQKSGSQAIGLIVTRDGCIRFFSVSTSFHATLLGTGVKEIAKNVFTIARQDYH
jgi:proteasome lid subunit RPN8/RPN11